MFTVNLTNAYIHKHTKVSKNTFDHTLNCKSYFINYTTECDNYKMIVI